MNQQMSGRLLQARMAELKNSWLLMVSCMLFTVQIAGSIFNNLKVECYDFSKNKWNLKTETTIPGRRGLTNRCLMRIFKGFLPDHQLESFISRRSLLYLHRVIVGPERIRPLANGKTSSCFSMSRDTKAN